MNLKRSIYNILILALLGLSQAAHAAFEQADLIVTKSKLEEAIVKKYQDRISTRLQSDLYTVGAQVTLKVVKEKVDQGSDEPKRASGGSMDIPNDITLGVVSAITQREDASGNLIKEKIKITKVQVFVGLSPKLGEEYKKQFSEWLKNNIKSEFGAVGSAALNDFIAIKEEKVVPLTWQEKFGQYQNFIGLIAFALLFAISYILGKFVLSKDVKEQNAVALKIQELRAAMSASSSGPSAQTTVSAISSHETGGGVVEQYKEHSINPESASSVFESFTQQQKKVSFIALSSTFTLDQAVEMWMEQGLIGRSKLALVLDCVLAAMGDANFDESGAPKLSQEWVLPDSVKRDKGFAKCFRMIPTISLEEKTSTLEVAYWDLLSIKTLGTCVAKQRFVALSALSPESINKILSKQNNKIKALTMLHLPSEKLGQVTMSLSYEEKMNLVSHAFKTPNLSDYEIDMVDTTLTAVVQDEVKKVFDTVALPPLVPGVLQTLKPFEEIKIIADISANHPGGKDYLKENYPTLAFISDWPKDKLKQLMSPFRAQQILALLQAIPDCQAAVLEVLPGKTRAMVESDLGSKKYTDEEMDLYLQEIKSYMASLFDAGIVDLKSLFKETSNKAENKASTNEAA